MSTLHMGYARLLLLCLEQHGVDVQTLYGIDSLKSARGPSPAARISAHEWDRMVEMADERLPDLDMALTMAEFIKPMDIGPIGFLVMASRNLLEAVQVMEQFSSVLDDVYRVKVDMIDGRLTSVLHPVGTYRSPCLERLILGTMCWQNRWSVRREDLVFNADFAFAPPGDVLMRHYERTFGGALRFNAERSAVFRPPGAEFLPVARGDQGVQQVLRAQLTEQMAKLNDISPNVLQQVESIIRSRLDEGVGISIEEVATEMDVSVRTLQSRMEVFGLSYRELLDRVRHSMALNYIGNKSVPLIEVANMLGFSCQSSFIRAFRRWTHVSPGEYRRMKTQH